MPPVGVPGDECDPASCRATAEAAAASLASAGPAPTPFEVTTCSEPDVCQCVNEAGTVSLQATEADSCLVTGRLGCLYSVAEVAGCDAEDAASCEATCAEVYLARANDAMGVSVVVRASGCGPLGCRYVLQTTDQCYVSGDELTLELADCGATDDELLSSR
jgi:hypothetical protein